MAGAGVQAGQQDGDGLLDGTGAQQGQAEGQGGMGVGPNYGPGTDDAEMGNFEGDGYGPGADYGPGPAAPQNETEEDLSPFGWLFQLFKSQPESSGGSSGSGSSSGGSSGSGSSGSNSSGSGSSGSGSSGSGSQGGNR